MTKRKAPAKARKHRPRASKPARRPKTAKVSPAPKKRPLQSGGRFHGTPYRSSQAHYAEVYSKSLPTIKRWWKEGKPLDDPDAMGEYLSPRGRKPAPGAEGMRVRMAAGHPWAGEEGTVIAMEQTPMGKRPRVRLDNGQEVFGMADDDFEGPSRSAPKEDEEIPVTLDESFFAGTGFLAAIERLKKAERERAAAYFTAIHQKLNSIVVQNRFKEWICVIEPLRKLAKDEPEIRKANDLTVDKSEMDAAVGHIFNGFRTAARNMSSRAAEKIVGLKEYDEIVSVLEKEVEVLLRSLVKLTIDEAAAAQSAVPGE